MKRGKVFAIITDERKYQDAQQLDGRFEAKIYSVGAELTLLKVYLDKAEVAWATNYGDAPALHAIRKVAANAVRCMENHGALPRERKDLIREKDNVPFKEKE